MCRFVIPATASSAGRRRLLVVLVCALLIPMSAAADDAEALTAPQSTTAAGDDGDAAGSRTLASPLLDVGRLWVRATVRQARRAADLLLLTPAVASLALLPVAVLAAARLRRFLFEPIDRCRLAGECGYVGDGRQPLRDVVEQVRRRRAVGDVPPVYPNGWFALIESRQLAVGQVQNVCVLGKTTAELAQVATAATSASVVLGRVNSGSQAVTHDPLTHTKTDP